MKKHHLIWLCAIALAVIASCKEEKELEPTPTPAAPVNPDDVTAISLRATIALADSRKHNLALQTSFGWSAADSIGIFMQRNADFSAEGYALVPHSLAENGRDARFAGALRWEKSALQHNFYAYYPKVAAAHDATQIPVTIPAAQAQAGGGYDHLNACATLVASPAIVTAPRDITSSEQNKAVSMDFISAFSVIEFRFASFWRDSLFDKDGAPVAKADDLTISKVTLTSRGGSFAVADGKMDLTNPDFSSGFAHISGGRRDSTVTLTITHPTPVPVSEKMSIIPNNNASQPANPQVVFPASLTVLPNINAANAEEKWTVSIATNRGTFTRTIARRSMKPGEKYVIDYVVIAFDTTGMNLGAEQAVDNTPGAPWDGVVKAPGADQVNADEKTVAIREPGELAWLAQVVNLERNPELGVDTFFRGYTVLLAANIHLGDREWTPIGKTYQERKEYAFQGTFDGQGHMISNFKISSPNNADALYAGLFGCSGAQAIRNLRVQDMTIHLTSLTTASLAYVGGIVAYAPQRFPINLSGCSVGGTITVNYGTHAWSAGGICGWATNGSITACQSSVKITGTSTIYNSARADIGGLVGYANGVRIKDCSFEAPGKVEGVGHWNAGGIAGNAAGGSIVASKNTGEVKCNGGLAVVGGIVGLGRGDIIACYNTGNITANGGSSIYDSKGVGGIAGSFSSSSYSAKTLKGCYSTGTITRAAALSSRAGNVVGWYETFASSIPFDYSKVLNNYYAPKTMSADAPDKIGANRITRFDVSAWPAPTMDGWGVGNGSGDNTYWNVDFPAYGAGYPTLHWEKVY